jgi:hypothetical protein
VTSYNRYLQKTPADLSRKKHNVMRRNFKKNVAVLSKEISPSVKWKYRYTLAGILDFECG